MKQVSLYRHYDSANQLLYVGISASAVHRLGQHSEHSDWFASISRVTIEHFESRPAALTAEREAIINERPLHNIVHKKAALEAQRNADKKWGAIAQAKIDLTARVAFFKPVYSLYEAAEALSLSMRRVNDLVRSGEIGHFFMPTPKGRQVPYISGWQLIEYIEEQVLKNERLKKTQPKHHQEVTPNGNGSAARSHAAVPAYARENDTACTV